MKLTAINQLEVFSSPFNWEFSDAMLLFKQENIEIMRISELKQSQFLKNNAIVMAGTLISALLGYAFHFIVSRQISVAQYGELQSPLSVMMIFGVFNAALSYFLIKS